MMPSSQFLRLPARFLCALGVLLAVGLSCSASRAASAVVQTVTTVQAAPRAALVPGHAARFPLAVGPTGRYLVDSTGRPFMIVGDSPQSLIVNLSPAQASRYFADREAVGFNSVWINLLCDTYTGGRENDTTYDGIAPFTTEDDLATPNPAYFARVDDMLRLAAGHHLAVFLDPIETGGWLSVLRENGVGAAYDYGLYLGRRYRHFSNIVWLSGNDFQTWSDPQDDALVLAVAEGIRAADPNALQTVELNYLVSQSLDDANWSSVVNLNAAYTYAPTYAEVLSARHNGRIPTFMVEASYEGEHQYIGASTLRRQEYWTMLSGATGQFYGNRYTWPFIDGWSSHLDTIGTRQLTFMVNLFSQRRWFDLIPDTGHKLVVSGYGSYSDWANLNTNNYVTAAKTGDGKLAIVYLPTGQPIQVNMTQMAGPRVDAEWYDPTSGTYRTVKGTPLPRKGTRRFTVPGTNRAGDHDWVLVLTATKATAAK